MTAHVNQLGSSDEEVVVYRLKSMDPISITLKGIPAGTDSLSDVLDEQGDINLPYIGQVSAMGLTTSELEAAIYKAYVEGGIYKSGISVSVTAMDKSYYLWGEVRSPSRYPMIAGTTLLQAIASAGGYSPYANRNKIQLTRGGKKYFLDGEKLEDSPDNDPMIEAGDVIRVWRSAL
jgi:polysaccharide export outer membrane protein